jgi:hypothetical protein
MAAVDNGAVMSEISEGGAEPLDPAEAEVIRYLAAMLYPDLAPKRRALPKRLASRGDRLKPSAYRSS